MLDPHAELLRRERTADEARGRLQQAVVQLGDALTPSQVVHRIGQSARAQVSPLIDPVIERISEEKTIIALGLAASALVFGLGRASVTAKVPDAGAANAGDGNVCGPQDAPSRAGLAEGATGKAPISDRRRNSNGSSKTATNGQGGSVGHAILMSAVSLAVGSALGALIPVTERETRFVKSQGQDLKRWGRSVLKDHSSEMVQRTVNALGVTRSIGIGLGILGLAVAQLTALDARGPDKP